MLSAVKKFSQVSRKALSASMVPRSVRAFATDEGYGKISIPTDEEQQGGRRKQELDAEKTGVEGFNTSPVIPTHDQGSKENPILVLSQMHSRTVGFEDPNTNQLKWFNLDQGKLHYVPDIGLYFKLQAF
jgi:hypothetical protein